MSKTGDTKKRIYEILEQKNKTLTDISNELGLAPSTVSQHLQEMLDTGAIRLVEDRPRKWKYYEVNRGYPVSKGYMQYNDQRSSFDIRKMGIPIAVIAVVLISVFVFYNVRSTGYAVAQQVYLAPGSSVPAGSTVFSVSDAPSFYNISALVVTVDNASIHSESTGKWYDIPLQAKSFDLIQLDNISSVLSGVKLSNGVYDDLVLHISNVTATINGTVEPVTLPSGKLSIIGNLNISGNTTNWVNLDFDLAHSIHITSNGKVIMLPVINIRHLNDSNLEVNGSSIIVARYPGKARESIEVGMDQNGSMRRNFSAPQNISMGFGAGSSVIVSGQASIPIIIRSDHGLIIGGDATSLINATGLWANQSTRSNSTVVAYGRCIGALPSTAVNGTSASEEIAIRRCCTGVVPLANGNLSENGTAYTNATELSAGFGSSLPALGCCFPISVVSSSGKIIVRRCMQVGTTSNTSNQSWHPEVLVNSPIREQLNISMPNGNGNISANCALQNGALSCSSGRAGVPTEGIAVRIGENVARGTWSNVGVNSTVNGSARLPPVGVVVGTGAQQHVNVASTGSSNNIGVNSVIKGNTSIRSIVNGGGPCIGINGGKC